MKYKHLFLSLSLLFLFLPYASVTGQTSIVNQPSVKVITFSNSKLRVTLDYDFKCLVTNLEVNGESVLGKDGLFLEIRTLTNTYSTRKLTATPVITIGENRVTINNINYGDGQISIHEVWNFIITKTDIKLKGTSII